MLFPTALHSDAQGERGLDNALPWAEVAAADHDDWPTSSVDYAEVQALHETRYNANDSFALLIEELDAQRDAREQTSISLNEEVRQEEIAERETDQEERVELYRKAFGASSLDDDDDEDDGPVVADILLDEAANVLSDITITLAIKKQLAQDEACKVSKSTEK